VERLCALILGWSRNARDTVLGDTPAAAAMSVIEMELIKPFWPWPCKRLRNPGDYICFAGGVKKRQRHKLGWLVEVQTADGGIPVCRGVEIAERDE
jgi:hypothetical protein